MRVGSPILRVLRTFPLNSSIYSRRHHLSVPVMCVPNDRVRYEWCLQRMTDVLDLEDEESGDGFDTKGFGDVFLFLGLYLESQGIIA